MKFNLKNFLENKIVLYVIFFISLATVFGYIVLNNYAAVLFFILLAFLTNFFSKNMIVILGSAILGTHLLAVLNIFGNTREGYQPDKSESAKGDDGGGDEHGGEQGRDGGVDRRDEHDHQNLHNQHPKGASSLPSNAKKVFFVLSGWQDKHPMRSKFNLQLSPDPYETLLLTRLFNAFALPVFDGQGFAFWRKAQCDSHDH